jgi:predicted metal-binding membrane protein
VGGIAPQSGLDRGIEVALQRDRRVVAVSLVLVVALAWLYLWRDAAAMSHMQMAGTPMALVQQAVGAGTIVMIFAMWTIMMVGMMLPSAAPTILLYGALVRKNGERGTVLPAVWVFTSGYLVAWTGFSFAAALSQVALEQAALMTPMMQSASKGLNAAILIAAGIYQWLPLKEICLRKCRHPIEFFATRWRAGAGGAFRMGLEHGMYCVGCCWVLMLLLFVAGVMNLLWVALIAGFVFVEKLLPAARFTTRFASVALVLSGVVLLVKAV